MEYEVIADLPANLDAFTRAYLEAAEWCGFDGEEDRDALHATARRVTWSRASLKRAREICRDFQDANAALWADEGPYGDSRAGHDLWLTQNRHGAGFWDRGLKHGAALTEAAHAYGSGYVTYDRRRAVLHLEV